MKYVISTTDEALLYHEYVTSTTLTRPYYIMKYVISTTDEALLYYEICNIHNTDEALLYYEICNIHNLRGLIIIEQNLSCDLGSLFVPNSQDWD